MYPTSDKPAASHKALSVGFSLFSFQLLIFIYFFLMPPIIGFWSSSGQYQEETRKNQNNKLPQLMVAECDHQWMLSGKWKQRKLFEEGQQLSAHHSILS